MGGGVVLFCLFVLNGFVGVQFFFVDRQEIGGSRWQYGGDGKLHTFRSKSDLAETQGAGSARPAKGSDCKTADRSKSMVS